MRPYTLANDKIERHRFAFFQIGLILSIGFVLYLLHLSAGSTALPDLPLEPEAHWMTTASVRWAEPEAEQPVQKKQQQARMTEPLKLVPVKKPVLPKQATEEVAALPETMNPPLRKSEPVPPEFVLMPEVEPSFPGGESEMYRWISDNLTYPKPASNLNIQGTVFLQFIVTERGNVRQVKVLKGVTPAIDSAAVEVLRQMPRWQPGRQGGHSVNVPVSLPIRFILE